MNVKDRRAHLFLQLFFMLIGIYEVVMLLSSLQSGDFSKNLFGFQQETLPVITIAASMIVGIASLVSCFSMWTRASWAYGFALFTSGILFSYHLLSLDNAIYKNSYEIIPIVLVLIVILQSFPFLLRRSGRSV